MTKSLNRRRYVRADLRTDAHLRGTDKWGKPFDIKGESFDFSRRGLGLILDWVIVAPGAVINVELPGRLKANAVVQWVRFDDSLKSVRMGVHLVNPRTGFWFRIAASLLLATALLTQLSFAKSRWGFLQPHPGPHCMVGAQQMRAFIDIALAQPSMITDTEKTFVRLQHEQMSCGDYTRLFEQTNYYKSPGKREAMAKWHWDTFHAQEASGHGTAGNGIESADNGQ